MSNRPFGSLNKTIVNSSDYIAKKRQVAVYTNAARQSSGFGIAKETGGEGEVVVTARNHEELLTLTKGMHHCRNSSTDNSSSDDSSTDDSSTDNSSSDDSSTAHSSGADTLKYDIWSGNKMVVDYGKHNPVTYTGDLDAVGKRTLEPNMIPYPSTINGVTGYPGFIVDVCGTLFGTGELGAGPAWVNISDVSYTNTSDYKRGNKSQPLHNFHYPARVALKK